MKAALGPALLASTLLPRFVRIRLKPAHAGARTNANSWGDRVAVVDGSGRSFPYARSPKVDIWRF